MMAKRYSCPDFLLDGYISTGRFKEFVHEFWDIYQESTLYEFWLYKNHDKSFNDFKKTILNQPHVPIKKNLTEKELKAVIESSREMLTQFEFKEST